MGVYLEILEDSLCRAQWLVEGLGLGPGNLKLLLSSLSSADHFMGYGFFFLFKYTFQEIDVNIHIE